MVAVLVKRSINRKLPIQLKHNSFAALTRKTRMTFSPLERTKTLFWEFDHLRFEIGDLVTIFSEGGLNYCKLNPHG